MARLAASPSGTCEAGTGDDGSQARSFEKVEVIISAKISRDLRTARSFEKVEVIISAKISRDL